MEEYSQKEENTFRTELFRRMDHQDIDLKDIKIQTTKTNGRVSKLEWWRKIIIWVFGVLIALAIPIFDLIRQEIRDTVVSVLSDYNINVVR